MEPNESTTQVSQAAGGTNLASPSSGRFLTPAERKVLYAACGWGWEGRHAAAILCLLDGVGRTPAEAAALEFGDVDPKAGTLWVRDGVGAGHLVALVGPARRVIAEWVGYRTDVPGPLLVRGGPHRAGKTPRAMDAGIVEGHVQRLAESAGLPDVTAAGLRLGCILELQQRGAPLTLDADTGAWNSPATRTAMARRPVPVLRCDVKAVARIAARMDRLFGGRGRGKPDTEVPPGSTIIRIRVGD